MTAPARSIEVVQNLVLDTIAPFVERLEIVEHQLLITMNLKKEEPAQPESKIPSDSVLQQRLDAIVEMHRLDAVPALWQFVGGKREQAPEGLWEISCAVCKDHTLTWKQGDPQPARCKTVRVAMGVS